MRDFRETLITDIRARYGAARRHVTGGDRNLPAAERHWPERRPGLPIGGREYGDREAMSRLRSFLGDQRGFTLAELLVVAAILGVILAGVVFIQMQGQQAYLFGSHRVEVQQNNRAALELMVKELRSAQSVTAVTSLMDLAFTDENGDTIEYQFSGISGTPLTRAVTPAGTAITTPTPLIGGVQTLTMTCYSDWNGATNTGTTTTTPSLVKLIRLQLVTRTEDQVSVGSAANQYATMESLVRLRNIP